MHRYSWLLCVPLLVSCGSGSDPENDDDPGPVNGELTGFFLDDAVEGLQYDSGSGVRLTDEFGVFHFRLGEAITFLVDGVELGTIPDGLQRVTPNSFGAAGANIARFVQSLDTSPADPGIDLTGIDLADTPIDFLLSAGAFGSDAAVLAALAAAQTAGGTGVLVSQGEASARLAAGTNGVFTSAEIEDSIYYPITPGPESESCVVYFRADGTGVNVCADDVADNPTTAGVEFDWTMDGSLVELDFSPDELVTVQRLGDTGNRISVSTLSECLTCNPNVEPVFTTELQSLVTPLPISVSDFDQRTFNVFSNGDVSAFEFGQSGFGTLTKGGSARNMRWSLDPVYPDVLLVRTIAAPGLPILFLRAFLITGSATDGDFALLVGEGVESNGNSGAQEDEVTAYTFVDAVRMTAIPSTRTDCVDPACAVADLPYAGNVDAPTITNVTLECQSSSVVALATATDPQGDENLIGIIQNFGVYPDDSCVGAAIVLQDDLAGSGSEESFGDVVSSSHPLYAEICDCLTWPVELSFQDADGNLTTGRFAATVVL